MQETTIHTKGRTAKIWKQQITIGGIVTDENGRETYINVMNNKNYLKSFFTRYEKITGKTFF